MTNIVSHSKWVDRSSHIIKFKITVIEAINSGKKCSLVAEEFEVPRSILSTFLRDTDIFYAFMASDSVLSKTKQRTVKCETLVLLTDR